ncbi:hemolymph lipopolysaccharide-binding protein-like [Periplaneta americana]|uniref:hemolymph lipopolysaccharide-binding protein-like n=1 Tax=Periplaneta americana TaxID=6978 RepID=UPI0037E8935D
MSYIAMVLKATCVLLCVMAFTEGTTPKKCDIPHPSDLKLSVTSRRNQTGHWIAQAMLQHKGHQVTGMKNAGPWHMDMDHTTFTCEGEETITIIATVTAPPRIPSPNYELIPELGYYKLHTEGRNWHDARQICAQEGAHLAIINSEEEAEKLKAILARHPKLFSDWRNDYAYIGMSDIRGEGDWITIFGQHLNATGYTKWAPGQPEEVRKGNCGLMQRTGGLHDVPCEQEIAFLCEQEL